MGQRSLQADVEETAELHRHLPSPSTKTVPKTALAPPNDTQRAIANQTTSSSCQNSPSRSELILTRVSRPYAVGSGGRYTVGVDQIQANHRTDQANPFLDEIDGRTMQF